MKTLTEKRYRRGLTLIIRVVVFIFLVGLGLTFILLLDEKPGLALVDLSDTPVQTVATGSDGAFLYMALEDEAQAGLYRSNAENGTWQFVGPGPGVPFNTLVVHPANQMVLFAGSEGGPIAETNNLWRSEDGGQSWRKFFLSLPAQPDGVIPAVTSLAVDPNRPEVLYVGTEGQGVYRFDVGPEGSGYSLVGDVAFHDMQIKRLIVGANSQVYALTPDSLFASNNGDTWRQLAMPPETPVSLDATSAEEQKLYALSALGNVYRSTDEGQNWEKVGGEWWAVPEAPLWGTSLTVDKQDGNHVIISTAYEVEGQLVGGDLYETHNAGRNWAKVADLHGAAQQLILDHEAIYAVVPSGLIQYREAVGSASDNFWAGIPGLSSFSPVQLVILILTLTLAGLILLGRLEWLYYPRG